MINAHDPSVPFHMYLAWHNTHEPLEVPQAQLDKFGFVFDECTAGTYGAAGAPGKNNSCSAAFLRSEADSALGLLADKPCCFRQYYAAMTNYVDAHVGQVVDALKAKGMWDNLLLVMSSDNGGPIYRNGSAGANNYPLRGGKKSNFEGGVRVNAFVTGGLVPAARRGAVEEGFAASEDWFRTFAALAGVDPTDEKAAAAGLPPVEGFDLWPLLSGANSTSPRTEVWLGSGGAGDVDNSKDPIVQGLIRADGFKVLWGNVIENTWTAGTLESPARPRPLAPLTRLPAPRRAPAVGLLPEQDHGLVRHVPAGLRHDRVAQVPLQRAVRPDRAREPRGLEPGRAGRDVLAPAGADQGHLCAGPRRARHDGRVLRGRQSVQRLGRAVPALDATRGAGLEGCEARVHTGRD